MTAQGSHERTHGASQNGWAMLVAPAAVRMVDLDEPLADLRLPPARLGGAYRSLLAIARLDGDPLGTAVIPVEREGGVPRERLALELRQQLEAELREALAQRDLDLPGSLVGGIPGLPERPRSTRLSSVSVVVTTCCDPVPLRRCLRSILACDYDPFEVIVVENRPGSPATAAMLSEEFGSDPRLRYVEEETRGLSSARNAGLAVAEGDVVAFTDDDVIVDPAWIGRAAEPFECGDDVACVTGLILPLELETDSQLLIEQFMTLGKGFTRQIYRLPEARATHPLMPYTPGAIGSGANTVLRADVAWQLGGFDTTLGTGTPAAGGEDLDLYIRLLREGHAVAYEPSAVVWHAHPEGTAKLRRQVYWYGVGLGATLAKQLIAGPERRELVRAVPAGVRYARDPASRKNASKTADYPRFLDLLERLGMVVGPAAYLASWLVMIGQGRAPPSRRTTIEGRELYAERFELASGEVVDVVEVARPGASSARARARAEPAQLVASPAERVIKAIAVAACVLAPLFVALKLPAPLRFGAMLALLCLAPGTVLVSALRGRAELGLVLGVSMGVSVVLAQSMLWFDAWQPTAYLYGLAAVCLIALVPQLDQSRRRPTRALFDRVIVGVARLPPAARYHGALLTAAMVAWGISLAGADLTRMAGLGLVDAMPPTYFVAFALLMIGFAAAVTRDELHPKLLALYVLALALLLYGTIPLLYPEPRFTWSYKHFGVIELISATGAVDRTIDIYNNWPAFLAANAWLRSATGLSPMAYAAYSQLFFGLANVAAVRFALRGVTRDERLLWTATWLFLLGNWVQPTSEDLAPQAFGFVLSLVILGLCLRCRPASRPEDNAPRWLDRFATAVLRRRAPDDPVAPAPLGPRGGLILGGVCFLAVVLSHQLSPVMVILGVIALSLVVPRLPLWIPAAMIAIEVWWVALAWPFLSSHFSVVAPGWPGAAPAGRDLDAALPGAALSFYAPGAVVVLVAMLALVGGIRRLRAGKWDIAPASLVVVVPPAAAVQSYGGIGLYRAFLFALPWLAFFGAAALVHGPSRRRAPQVRFLRTSVVTLALGICLLLACFGQDLGNRVTPGEVRAETWVEQHAPPASRILHMAEGPSFLTARYPRIGLEDSLLTRDQFRGHRLGAADIPRIRRLANRLRRGLDAFMVLSRRQEDYARLNGVLPEGSIASLRRALQASPSFRLVYRAPGAWVFEYEPRPRGRARS